MASSYISRPETPKNMDDLQLIARACDGMQEAFSELVVRYHQRIFQAVYALVGDRDEADDLAQEAFLKAYRSLSNFRGQSQLYTWLYRIAINSCLDWMKSRNRRNDLSLDREPWAEHSGDRRFLHHPESSDARVSRRELQENLECALATLPDEYRATFILREMDGLAYEEIAGILECSVGTVKSRLFRARAQLRDALNTVYEDWCENT